MRLLLDTHVMLWWLKDNPRLGQKTRALIARQETELLVSIASFWELSIKNRLGKVPIPGSTLLGEAERSGMRVLDVRAHHLDALEAIVARARHNDPFDHLILAQAIAEDSMLVTSDQLLLDYDIRSLRAS